MAKIPKLQFIYGDALIAFDGVDEWSMPATYGRLYEAVKQMAIELQQARAALAAPVQAAAPELTIGQMAEMLPEGTMWGDAITPQIVRAILQQAQATQQPAIYVNGFELENNEGKEFGKLSTSSVSTNWFRTPLYRAAPPLQIEPDAKRLVWAMSNMTNECATKFAMHVLNRGGIGDISDCRTFIDNEQTR